VLFLNVIKKGALCSVGVSLCETESFGNQLLDMKGVFVLCALTARKITFAGFLVDFYITVVAFWFEHMHVIFSSF